MIMKKNCYLVLLAVMITAASNLLIQCTSAGGLNLSNTETWITFSEVRTASDRSLVLFFNCDSTDIDAIDISNPAEWKINGEPAAAVHRYVFQTDGFNHHIYLETDKFVKGKTYKVETPYGNAHFKFDDTKIFCESIKTNQVGYSALSTTRYANFAIWLGTGGSRQIEGALPDYTVVNANGKTVASGKLKEIGEDTSAGGYVYRINLSDVPEGGPYKITVDGIGSSYLFGVGGEFSNRLAYTIFRAQYLQRCGCPVLEPALRMEPCHTLIYKVDGPIGEANIDVVGDEETFIVHGGYHDAGDADRRAYHISNPMLNLMIYETFPEYFTDGQFRIPGDFDADYHILNYENNIPDIIDEALWGTLAWEYLQTEDGSIYWGTETRGYAEPFSAPYDHDIKKYGTVRFDNRATSPAAGLFLHLARIIKPYNPQKADELLERGDRAYKAAMDPKKAAAILARARELGERAPNNNGWEVMAEPEQLYYHIQRYLLTQDKADYDAIRRLYTIVDGLKESVFLARCPGYSLNDGIFDNPAYIMSYILEKNVPTDPDIVDFFKAAMKAAADANIDELRTHAFPVGNDPANGGWGHNVRQTQYAMIPLLHWQLTKDQKYFDAASELMDYKLGLNPIGVCYVTGLGSHQVYNIHDRESTYTKEELGWGSKPGITVFGPGVVSGRNIRGVIPTIDDLSKERQYVDDRALISFNEFTIFETMHYDALYTILAGGGKWNGNNPFE